MSTRTFHTILLACSLAFWGCGTDDATSSLPVDGRSPEEATPQARGAPSAETGSAPMNPYPAQRGDVAAASARAKQLLMRPAHFTPRGHARITEATGAGTLVLYDTTGPWGWLGELYAINVGSLVSHFGTWTAKPVSGYAAGEMGAYAAVVYIGSTFDEPLPTALLDDVLDNTRPVIWIDDNIWELAARSPAFASSYGFAPWIFDMSEVGQVEYKGVALSRYLPNGAGIMTYSELTSATVLANAVRKSDGARVPWAVRGRNLTYIGENPLSYVTATDRYLAFCDLLFDALAPNTPERHRALVRIEDVSADADPAALKAIADYLAQQRVPFSVATIPTYVDPKGVYNDGVPQTIPLRKAPSVVSALKYMVSKGGTIVMHGYTHQHGSAPNPYNGVSADDFEFYKSHIDAANYVIYDGPVANDSQAWAAGRIASGLKELKSAGLGRPEIFEYPHYAGSVADSSAVRASFSTVYHRGLYFGGQLTGAAPDYTRIMGVMYPFSATDVFGLKVIPETLGSYEPEAANNNPPRYVPDLLAAARANFVVRDGVASFYFHPYYPVSILKQIVSGLKSQGYTFVRAADVL